MFRFFRFSNAFPNCPSNFGYIGRSLRKMTDLVGLWHLRETPAFLLPIAQDNICQVTKGSNGYFSEKLAIFMFSVFVGTVENRVWLYDNTNIMLQKFLFCFAFFRILMIYVKWFPFSPSFPPLSWKCIGNQFKTISTCLNVCISIWERKCTIKVE